MDKEMIQRAYQAAADWVCTTFPNGEERYPHWPMIEAAIKASQLPEELEKANKRIKELEGDLVAIDKHYEVLWKELRVMTKQKDKTNG